MRYGFTTGSCAAACAKAATLMLLTGQRTDHISIMTPSGKEFSADITDIDMSDTVSCAVRKPASDDPDVTAGMLIYAKASLSDDGSSRVIIKGGRGIGRITRPGLDRKVGDWAINTVPRLMIEEEVRSVMDDNECISSITIEISAPGGEAVALKTFNPKLGIEGGISIIGTSGLVEPMSTKALIETIRISLRQKYELGSRTAVVTCGNYGRSFLKEGYGYDLDGAVKCSNYIGHTIDMARQMGYEGLVLVGHMGKLIKISGGIMNTHSKEADCRMELMASAAIRGGASAETAGRILDCVTTEEAHKCILDAGIETGTYGYIRERMEYYLHRRAEDMEIGFIVFLNSYGIVCESQNAAGLMSRGKDKERA